MGDCKMTSKHSSGEQSSLRMIHKMSQEKLDFVDVIVLPWSPQCHWAIFLATAESLETWTWDSLGLLTLLKPLSRLCSTFEKTWLLLSLDSLTLDWTWLLLWILLDSEFNLVTPSFGLPVWCLNLGWAFWLWSDWLQTMVGLNQCSSHVKSYNLNEGMVWR